MTMFSPSALPRALQSGANAHYQGLGGDPGTAFQAQLPPLRLYQGQQTRAHGPNPAHHVPVNEVLLEPSFSLITSSLRLLLHFNSRVEWLPIKTKRPLKVTRMTSQTVTDRLLIPDQAVVNTMHSSTARLSPMLLSVTLLEANTVSHTGHRQDGAPSSRLPTLHRRQAGVSVRASESCTTGWSEHSLPSSLRAPLLSPTLMCLP